ncbi:MAG: hypothetical protein ACD_73C00343G0002 [uncultured bacterium]|nr:MAG: hypothetical protein ACD_73C00343G0002 [uncultured bacterium]
MDSENQDSFKIKDKRRFNADGSIKEDVAETIAQEPPKQQTPQGDFKINFSTFILSLASSVQIALGLIPHPASGKSELNLVSARQTIDILALLEDKTRNNLTNDEAQIMKHVLHDLRMSYVAAQEQVNKQIKK